jgi:DNA-binding MarR family transcriptional regulator
MKKIEKTSDTQYLFGALFLIANKVDTLLGREFKKFDITTKQWFLSIVIDNLFDNPPTIKEVAKEMGSSHQNVKQVALKLQEKDLLILDKDEKDARVTRLKLTEYSYSLLTKLRKEGNAFIESLFKGIEKDELTAARKVIQKIISNADEMDMKNNNV